MDFVLIWTQTVTVAFPGSMTLAKIFTTLQVVCMLSCFSHVRLCATLWTVAHQAHLSMGFSRQEYWSGLPPPLPGNLPDPRD